ncbi:TPA: hypothetical protein TT917_001964 [Streptococcus equi subsp. zooepidemicus]|uniref:hypothetical protein n=1 Tax=Streptococcus equi TaxID=1336 RepID=UPI000DA363AA|nr:hypothetical protein [Streptococcus equi]MCD3370294.1 hypothetical protein [Streptococcus equi subsp. zooepidemicus]MCD3379932.1 hypothetical protein [Streptococcus equi subsp. zooepidemicus]MCD3390231.1 hypothetical protein [Streptococcus equi subsp. zooepidemicus]MDI5917107.1 hypothetical protein [Streptococcus equi subsp. zooepidemicus]SQF04802.1 Uncharacterised protein [Streptococcus equi subsp. zooepidemicus]
MKELKEELMKLLLKIGVTSLNESVLFEEKRPRVYFPEGQTVFLENNIYYVIGVEHGKVNSERTFGEKEDILYFLLGSYVNTIAGKCAWEKVNGDFEQYGKLLPEEQIRVFSMIAPKYGQRRKQEIEAQQESDDV